MIDVKSVRCFCKLAQPTFNLPGLRAKFCQRCKSADMVDVKSRMCSKCQERIASFNFTGSRPDRCAACKDPGMVDLCNPKCLCWRKTKPTYAYPGQRPSHCSKCKLQNMVDVVHDKCGGCRTTIPTYGFAGGTRTHCGACRLPGMVDVFHPVTKCSSCGLYHQTRTLRDTICPDCHVAKPRAELRMRNYLVKNIPGDWQFDRTTAGVLECSDKRYRPDCWLETPTMVLNIECDEHQHKYGGGSYKCELKRVGELLAACRGKPLNIIRWNPDSFSIAGLTQDISELRRLRALRTAAETALSQEPSCLLTVRYMFYDDNGEADWMQKLETAFGPYLRAGR